MVVATVYPMAFFPNVARRTGTGILETMVVASGGFVASCFVADGCPVALEDVDDTSAPEVPGRWRDDAAAVDALAA